MALMKLLELLALVCFVLATIGATIPRINPLGLGLAFWMLALLLA